MMDASSDSSDLENVPPTEIAYDLGLQDIHSNRDTLGGGDLNLYFVLPFLIARANSWLDGRSNLEFVPWRKVDKLSRMGLDRTMQELIPERLESVQKGLTSWESKLRRASKQEKVNLADTLVTLPEMAKRGVPHAVVLGEVFPAGLGRKKLWSWSQETEYLWLQCWTSGEQQTLQRARAGRLEPQDIKSMVELVDYGETRDGLLNFLATTNDPEFWHVFVDLSNYDHEFTYHGLNWIVEQPNCDQATLCLMFLRLNGMDFVGPNPLNGSIFDLDTALIARIIQRFEEGMKSKKELYCPEYFVDKTSKAHPDLPKPLVLGNPSGRPPRTCYFIEDDCLIFRRDATA